MAIGVVFPVALANFAVVVLVVMGVWVGAAIVHNPAPDVTSSIPTWLVRCSFILVDAALVLGLSISVQAMKAIKVEEGWPVNVTFGDSPLLTTRKKWLLKKTVNEYYVYLKALGLSPPVQSPVMKVDMGLFVCSPPMGSLVGETASIRPERLGEGEAIANAYSFCFFQRSILRGAEMLSSDAQNRNDVSIELSDYFASAFSGRHTSSNKLSNALLAVRDKCGADFTDGAVARAIEWMGAEQKPASERETVAQFFHRHFVSGVVQMRTSGENQKPDDAEAILKEQGFAPDPQ